MLPQAGRLTAGKPLQVGLGVIGSQFHAAGQRLSEYERGGGLELGVQLAGGAGGLEPQVHQVWPPAWISVSSTSHLGSPARPRAPAALCPLAAGNLRISDPLSRAPEAVARDVARGWLDRDGATRVYAVAWADGGAVDEPKTQELRNERRMARLAAATPPAAPAGTDLAGDDAELRPVGGDLGVLVRGGRPTEWVSLPGRVRLGPVTGDYRTACAVLETPVNELAPEFGTRPGRPGAAIVLREYLCPVSGARLATELIRAGDEPAADMVLAGGAG